MKKKNALIYAVVALLTLTVILILTSTRESVPEQDPELISLHREYLFESVENYKTEEGEEENTITNKNIGVFFNTPVDWKIIKEETEEQVIRVTSPCYTEAEFSFEGCELYFLSFQEKEYAHHLQDLLKSVLEGERGGDYSVFEENDFQGVLFEGEKEHILRIAEEERVYEAGFRKGKNPPEDCLESFYKLISSLHINYE